LADSGSGAAKLEAANTVRRKRIFFMGELERAAFVVPYRLN
jgi:hypothetical protein